MILINVNSGMFRQQVTSLFLGLIAVQFVASQNVGIGTGAPTRGKLVVSGVVGRTNTIISNSGTGSGLSIQANYPAIGFNQYFTDQSRYINSFGKAGVWWLNMVTGSLVCDIFYTQGSINSPALNPVRVATISQNGNVSFNTAEANASLFVGYSATNYITRFQGTSYHSEFNRFQSGFPDVYSTVINGGKQGSDVYINDQSTGSINIGTRCGVNRDPDGAALDIKQFNRGFVLVEPSTFHNWEFITTKNLTEPNSDFYLYYNGAYKGNFFHIDGGWYPISDARLKKEIKPVASPLSKVLQLKPVQYHMKEHTRDSHKLIGFLAQQVQTVFPELVDVIREKDIGYPGLNEIYTMNYDGLAPVIIGAIQEQQSRIRELEKWNVELKEKIERLKKLKQATSD